MKRTILLALIMVVLVSLHAKSTLLSTRGSELLVEYTLDEWEVVASGAFSRIVAKEMDFNTVSGAPLIPYDVFKIGLPPSGDYSFSILESETTTLNLSSKLLPVPTITMKNGLSDYAHVMDASKYIQTAEELVKVTTGGFRDYKLASFVINPFSYNGQTELVAHTRLLIRIQLQGDLNYRSSTLTDPATDIMLGQILNTQQARYWRSSTRAQINYADFSLSNYWLRVETNREGIHRLNYSQLSSFHPDELDPRMLRMFCTSGKVIPINVVQPGPEFREVPIYISNEASGVFGASDYILFYGSSRDSYVYNTSIQSDLYMNPYSQNQVFWLSFGNGFGGIPQRITLTNPETAFSEVLNNTPAFKHVESETHKGEDSGFTWYGSRFFGNTSLSYPIQTELTDVDTTGISDIDNPVKQSLSFRIKQEDVGGSQAHNISVEVNGVLVKNNENTGSTIFSWSGTSFYTFNKNLDSLINGNNSIKINVIRNTTDNLYFDWYRVSYRQNLIKGAVQKLAWHQQTSVPRAYRYNLSGNLANLMIIRADSLYAVEQIPLQGSYFISTGTSSTKYFLLTPSEAYAPAKVEYVEPVDLTSDTSQIDNIIITPLEFLSRAQTLAQKYFTTYGVRSRVVLQDDIFNQFSGGHPDPAAIRQAVRYYYHNLPAPKLSSITLLGLGTMDWRNFSGASAAKNKIIVWQSNYIGSIVFPVSTVSDDFFAMISSNTYPELSIGRYPVRTAAELDIMLQNFSRYTETPTPGWWRNSMLFIGDDLNNGSYTGEDIHTIQAEDAGNIVDKSILVDKIFAWEYEYDEFQNKPRARNDMFKAINEGRLVWCYIGHGAFDKLGAEDYLNAAVDMGRFANHDKLPLFIASSCSVSHFDYWGYESLGQKVVQMDNLGAIASYAATRISYPDSNQQMLVWVLKYLANQRYTVGASIMGAKLRSSNTSNNTVYNLLGDPLLRIVPPERDNTMEVVANDTKGLLHSGDTAQITGSFSGSNLSGEAEIRVYDTQKSYNIEYIPVSHQGTQLYRGSADVSSSAFNAGFVVPVDVITGNNGLVVSYIWDEANKKDYTSFHYPLALSDQAQPNQPVDNTGPSIQLYLGSYDFRSGDTVNSATTLYVKLADSLGINITDSRGHSILLVVDNSLQPIPITQYFRYDKGSYKSGVLAYPLSGLSEGLHTLQVIAFDNFNNPSQATTTFIAKQSSELSIERLLVYPNPISKEGFITFILSSDAEVNIGFYTLRGKRIRTIKAYGRKGFNSIPIVSKDDRGDTLANNTYFVKVKAASATGKSVEQTERMVIFK
ncbi:MAG: hypothetical protein CVU50_00350 [Candidatus Cloacimonetes bacterium HGW-Cloacimonetes-3]|jgi:hypothetical protein|nr:MAG: hypothetical protein CVU50_00350 [Candidatus Cloacimonetes bacterium HGW-Cloacimonetes-3]